VIVLHCQITLIYFSTCFSVARLSSGIRVEIVEVALLYLAHVERRSSNFFN
jgi:hypothetical protein